MLITTFTTTRNSDVTTCSTSSWVFPCVDRKKNRSFRHNIKIITISQWPWRMWQNLISLRYTKLMRKGSLRTIQPFQRRGDRAHFFKENPRSVKKCFSKIMLILKTTWTRKLKKKTNPCNERYSKSRGIYLRRTALYTGYKPTTPKLLSADLHKFE